MKIKYSGRLIAVVPACLLVSHSAFAWQQEYIAIDS